MIPMMATYLLGSSETPYPDNDGHGAHDLDASTLDGKPSMEKLDEREEDYFL